MIDVVLADDHNIVRQGLRKLLEREPDVRVVGEAADGAEATRLVERLQPDVLVVDIMMGGMNGIEVTRHVRQVSPKTRVVVLSMHDDEEFVIDALRAGARAYVLKDAIADDLLRATREVVVGGATSARSSPSSSSKGISRTRAARRSSPTTGSR